MTVSRAVKMGLRSSQIDFLLHQIRVVAGRYCLS